jgi:copper(I)-binding protein|tara:strand:- start:4 stop:465 length:462 start_codon:yes stop_codon:yes gene_type:complete
MKKIIPTLSKTITSFLLLMLVTSVQAQNLTVTEGFIRESIPGTTISSAYMTLTNTSEKSVTLVGVSSKVSARIEMHEHSMSNGMMSMRQLESILINRMETVILQPSGLHLMIFDIKEPLKQGDLITLTLHFSSHANVEVQLPVQGIKRKKHHH